MNVDLIKILAVGAGGFIGASGRYLVSVLAVQQFQNTDIPYGTAIANLLGCFIIGVLAALFQKYEWGQEELRLFLFVGMLGGFTTFSTFAHESFLLWETGESLFALLNLGLQIVLGLVLVWLGYMMVRLF
ncbi:MAG: fluoride efflux transporter CrcB [Balneolaceae bacterium]|nr:fluoride efflux transporter CrcB [Balneolaceae bacterium]